MTEVQQYTAEKLIKELLLACDHARDFVAAETTFCAECLEKHFFTIEAYCEEAAGFFDDPEPFRSIGTWSRNTRKSLNDLDTTRTQAIASKGRDFRKQLVRMTSDCAICAGLTLEPESKPTFHGGAFVPKRS